MVAAINDAAFRVEIPKLAKKMTTLDVEKAKEMALKCLKFEYKQCGY